jgi:predicted secreted Zn-dependent protease
MLEDNKVTPVKIIREEKKKLLELNPLAKARVALTLAFDILAQDIKRLSMPRNVGRKVNGALEHARQVSLNILADLYLDLTNP